MDPKVKEALARYEEIKIEEKDREKEKTQLQAIILPALDGEEVIKAHYGTIVKSSKTTYTHTQEVKDLEEEIKEKKKDEIRMGIATPKTIEFLRYDSNEK